MHLARVGGALAPADPVLDPPLNSTVQEYLYDAAFSFVPEYF